METKLIKKPKVFISYSWAGEDYEKKVHKLCTALKQNGIEVIYDKWSLKPGNDLNHYMEKSVVSEDITNVLILLDPSYTLKANNRSGGVGKETQIISEEVYTKVEQRKFIPVIMQRDEDGNIEKPAYLSSIYHVDLSDNEQYEDNLKDLIRLLFGIDIYEEPPLGAPPDWLNKKNDVIKVEQKFLSLKKKNDDSVKAYLIQDYISNIVEDVKSFNNGEAITHIDSSLFGKYYLNATPIRDNFLELLKMSKYVADGHKYMIEALEKIYNIHHFDFRKDIFHLLCYELIIYLAAFYLKYNRYSEVSYLLNHKFILYSNGTLNNTPSSYIALREYSEHFDSYIKKRDNKNYYSGIAHYWYEATNKTICDTEDFVYADEFLYNASIFIFQYDPWAYWFPIMYYYDRYTTNIKKLSMKLKTKEFLDTFSRCLGFSDTMAFKTKYKEIEQKVSNNNIFKQIKYSGSFDRAVTVFDHVKSKELGIF